MLKAPYHPARKVAVVKRINSCSMEEKIYAKFDKYDWDSDETFKVYKSIQVTQITKADWHSESIRPEGDASRLSRGTEII